MDAPFAFGALAVLMVACLGMSIFAAINTGSVRHFPPVLFMLTVAAFVLHTGNMLALPFEDNSFDVVVSSLAIHNIRGSAGREKAVNEAVRVLRPGGRLLIADMRGTRQHEVQLAKIGMNDVARRRLGWRFWWGGPWAETRLVTATKPESRG